jgi:predicted DCC family thiol-disulfide oxidoreductase YuxK
MEAHVTFLQSVWHVLPKITINWSIFDRDQVVAWLQQHLYNLSAGLIILIFLQLCNIHTHLRVICAFARRLGDCYYRNLINIAWRWFDERVKPQIPGRFTRFTLLPRRRTI